jgi:hypothetical protein
LPIALLDGQIIPFGLDWMTPLAASKPGRKAPGRPAGLTRDLILRLRVG